jgi:heme exporter protein A
MAPLQSGRTGPAAARVLQRWAVRLRLSTLQPHRSSKPKAPHLTVRGLACQRGSRRLFNDVDLDVHAGEVVWVTGRNGRGKTSLLRLVAGIAAPERGQIRFGDELCENPQSLPLFAQSVFIGHANALKDDLTVAEALSFLLRIHGQECNEFTVTTALTRWDMLELRNALVRTLSQGQRRRAALSRLVVHRAPALWVLDEPFDSLDSGGVDRLNEQLAEHIQRGGSALITGHQPALSDGIPRRDFDLDRYAAHTFA